LSKKINEENFLTKQNIEWNPQSLRKASCAANVIDKMADDIEAELYQQGRQELPAQSSANMVMTSLKK